MNKDQIFSEFTQGFAKRKFSAALLLSFIDLLKFLNAPMYQFSGLDDFLARFPANKLEAATLIVDRGDSLGTVSIRGFYDFRESFFRAKHGRLDYPSCAPYATGRWRHYEHWLNALTQLSDLDLDQLSVQVVEYVLDTLPDQRTDPKSIRREAPLFKYILESFPMVGGRKEPPGSGWQGTVFGFLRADNPHLQIEVRKVHTGSKRLQRVGDIDAWDGSGLALSAEAKHYRITHDNLDQFAEFIEQVRRRSAIGIVAALSFDGGAREAIEGEGVRAVDAEELLRMVSLWDPAKQRIAVASLIYYAQHVEGNSSLTGRLQQFITDNLQQHAVVAADEPLAQLTAAESKNSSFGATAILSQAQPSALSSKDYHSIPLPFDGQS